MPLSTYAKIGGEEWALHFVFERSPKGVKDFEEVRSWFNKTFTRLDEARCGWRSDQTTLTAFVKNEPAYIFSLLRWL